MATYVVRIAEGGEFVGVVSCDDVREMFMIVDEFVDPGACEFVEVPAGMIYARNGAPIIPDEMREDTDDPDLWSGAAASEQWGPYLHGILPGGDGHAWLSVDDLVESQE